MLFKLVFLFNLVVALQGRIIGRYQAHDFADVKDEVESDEDEGSAETRDLPIINLDTDPNLLPEIIEERLQENAIENNGLTNIKGENGAKVLYGDMMLTPEENEEMFETGNEKKKKNKHAKTKDVITDFTSYWSLRIPVTFDDSLSGKAMNAIKAGIEHIEESTCLRFKAKEEFDRNYINFFKGTGCWSRVGRIENGQNISIGENCETRSTAVHEIMHALGFVHEQQRTDRDKYVKILWDNIEDEEKKHNFNKTTRQVTTLGHPYDMKSVMHYSRNAFGKKKSTLFITWSEREETIQKIPHTDDKYTFGQPPNGGLSQIDKRQVNEIYCENPRDILVENGQIGLHDFLKHRLSEYPPTDLKNEDFREMFEEKLKRVYPTYDISVNLYNSHNNPADSAFICEKCVYEKNDYGRDVVLAYSKGGVNAPNEVEKNLIAEEIQGMFKTDTKSCTANQISFKIMKMLQKKLSVTLVLVVNLDHMLATDRKNDNAVYTFVRCGLGGLDEQITYLIKIVFGN